MRPFAYARAANVVATLDALRTTSEAALLAGGTTLVDLMKLNVMTPAVVLDITSLAEADPSLAAIQAMEDGGVRVGALATMGEVAEHPLIRERYPMVTQALLKGASAQLRNMATIGGNLLQRTRCVYFRDVTVAECNKRDPGSGCAARHGLHRNAAVLGASAACIALHPSDLAVPLVALDAIVQITGQPGPRQVTAGDFFFLPGETPWRETVLGTGELITAVVLPPLPAGTRSHYLKVRDRESYEFALTSAAVAVQVAGGVIHWARVALGGVGTIPWRALETERVLTGEKPSAALFAAAAAEAVRDAAPLPQNAFKIMLVQRTLERALTTVTAGAAP
jgi:xanthine dehydrogenase YagS FAD-binding subunit